MSDYKWPDTKIPWGKVIVAGFALYGFFHLGDVLSDWFGRSHRWPL